MIKKNKGFEPFDKVVVLDDDAGWMPCFYSKYFPGTFKPHLLTNGKRYKECFSYADYKKNPENFKELYENKPDDEQNIIRLYNLTEANVNLAINRLIDKGAKCPNCKKLTNSYDAGSCSSQCPVRQNFVAKLRTEMYRILDQYNSTCDEMPCYIYVLNGEIFFYVKTYI